MKIAVCGLLFLLLFSHSVMAQQADFREVAWGMSKALVMETETAGLKADDGNIVIYDAGKVKNMPALATYYFTADDQLYMAAYSYNPQSFDGERLISRYNDIKKALSKQLGEPVNDVVQWVSAEERLDFNNNTELGLLAAKCSFETEWNDDGAVVLLSLEHGAQSLVITESYRSLEHMEARQP